MENNTAHISRRCRPFIASAIIASALLASIAARTPAASGTESASPAFTQTRTVAHHHGVPPSYGWPVKPFNRQHPVRGYLNDPRGAGFHFGIDISAPDGTPVYAVEAGYVSLISLKDMAVWVRGATRTFSYWHIAPAVRQGQSVRLHQLLGTILKRGSPQHVHLGELLDGVYVNPLRPGGIGPYVDRTPPTVRSVRFFGARRELAQHSLRGRIAIIAEVIDTPPMLVPQPWSNLPVTPARLEWSVFQGSRRVIGPLTTLDSRAQLPESLYYSLYAPGTRGNRPGHPGRYRYYLERDLSSSRLPRGISRLVIKAFDTRGNRVVASVEIGRARAR